KSDNDPGEFGQERKRKAFAYSFFVTGSQKITIRNRQYTEPTIIANNEKVLSWLRENALSSKGKGWFAVGFGAFRRLTRSNQIIVPSLQSPTRYTNFLTQFNENEPLAAFERWMIYLDYQIIKDGNKLAKKQRELGVQAINSMLPEGVSFDSITSDGKILFNTQGQKVPTINLSDGYRSVLALVGDMIWRMLEAFPDSDNPLNEEGVVLIDELDIHLHPIWQRFIAQYLRKQFPNVQFIVATHSPLIAAGAGEDAVAYRFKLQNNVAQVSLIKPAIFAMDVNQILQTDAFGLISPFSPDMELKLERYHAISRKKTRNSKEENELQALLPFVSAAIHYDPTPDRLEMEIEAYITEKLGK
nr:AAA family ATPase [Spirosomataceae bacterium]